MCCGTTKQLCQSSVEVKDYRLDFSFDDQDTIASAVWTVESGLTLGSGPKAPVTTETTTTAWLSGGVPSATYAIQVLVTTTKGRVLQRTLSMHIED